MNSLLSPEAPQPIRPMIWRRPPDTVNPATSGDVRQLENQVRKLTRDLVEAQSRDRDCEKFAAHLHDVVGQQIVLVRLKISELRPLLTTGESPRLLDELVALVSELSGMVRSATFELANHQTDESFLASLRRLAEETVRLWGLLVTVDSPANLLAELPEPVSGTVCNVVRELCLNAHKHAQASEVRITLRCVRRCLLIAVRDDGDGIAFPIPRRWRAHREGGFGLASAQLRLQELGGRLSVSSSPGQGTCVCLVVPIAPDHPVRPSLRAEGRTS